MLLRSVSKNTRSPTFATRSSWLPGRGPAPVVAEPAPLAAAFWSPLEQAPSSVMAASAPRILMFISVLVPADLQHCGRYRPGSTRSRIRAAA